MISKSACFNTRSSSGFSSFFSVFFDVCSNGFSSALCAWNKYPPTTSKIAIRITPITVIFFFTLFPPYCTLCVADPFVSTAPKSLTWILKLSPVDTQPVFCSPSTLTMPPFPLDTNFSL